jgi:acyl transferase domain-containing protein/acyl carrier protein
LVSSDLSQVDAWTGTGGALSIIANRVSYFFDLRGPSVTVDTACSSSLVAVHLAGQSLRSGESNLAIAAGVNLLLSPAVTRSFDQAEAMSPTGGCHPFDAAADGFVRGEGCGVVVLKRLSDALRDGNRVLAVVRGSAVNSDGRSNGLMAPNPAAQVAVLRAAYANAGVEPRDVDYVEAHGTGTLLGDPIEARALGTVLGPARPQGAPLLIGALKSNLGHLEAAAGIAGFIKAVLAVQRGRIPANLGFEDPNPHIPFEDLQLKVVAEPTAWPATGHPRRTGVSSFGFGGTNAHVVLEQAPATEPVAPEPEPVVSTLVVSGKTSPRIASTAAMLADWMSGEGADVPLHEVAHTVNHHRSRQAKFATVAACDREQAVAGLRALAEGYPGPGVVGAHEGSCRSGTVFVYSGQGSQWAGMGRRLLVDEPAFAEAVAGLEPVFVEQVGFSLQQVLESGEPVIGIDRIQPVLVGMQLALTELWRCYRVQPDAVIGHSMGEVSAAVAARALSPAEGLRVIATRSRLMSRLTGQGAMALLELDPDSAKALIAGYPDVTLAVYASPRQSVIAGPPQQVDAAIAVVAAADRLARRIEVDVASHHRIIDPVLPQLRSALSDLAPRPPSIPVITTTGEHSGAVPVFDADYWAANLRNPVQFSQAVAAAGTEYGTFVEVSPHPVLTYTISDTLSGAHHHSIGTLQRDSHDTLAFRTNLNATHTIRPPNTDHPVGPHPVIPTTPWRHTHHWISAPQAPKSRRRNGTPVALRSQGGDGVPVDWYHELTWPVCELPEADTTSDSSWLVLADAAVGDELREVLGMGSVVAHLAPTVLEEDGGTATLHNALNGTENVLYAPAASSTFDDVASTYHLFNAVRRLAATLGGASSTSKPPPKLFVVTRNAQPIEGGGRANPAHAILWGLGRTLALEHPEIWGGIVDVDETAPPELMVRYVLAEVGAADDDDQVVYQAGLRHVPRLERRIPTAVSVATLSGGTSHLVIGATGSIGPHLIRQLSDMGAKTIIAVSRHAGARLTELASSLASTGTNLVEVAADAADEAAMAALFQRFGADLPPLDGIYLAALAGGPVLLSEMTDDDVNTMFRPKLDAVSVLHKLALKTPVRQFVLFSSITGVIGSRWLGHYTAAGAFLDTFAYARRALGLPATVVDWGLWKSVGEEQPETTDVGLQPMPAEVAIRALPTLLSPDGGLRCAVVAADWSRLAAAYRMRGSLRVVDDLLLDDSFGADPQPGTLLGEHISVGTTPAACVWQARLVPQTKPYPGSHRIQGVDVVPVSILLQTLAVAAAEYGGSLLSDVRFEYPIVADQPRVIRVVADEESVTVSSSSGADTAAHRWISHASARISHRLPEESGGTDTGDDHEMFCYDYSSVAELQRTWGIEGQPFPWSISSCRSAPDRLHADVSLAETSTVALLDAAVHVARLVDSSNPRLLLPATVESVCFQAELADAQGSVEVQRRGGNDDELIVDIVVQAPDGITCVDIRSLRYSDVESVAAQAAYRDDDPPATWDWSQIPAENMQNELEIRLRAILARELGMPVSAVATDRPFPELGLDSMMAMMVLREVRQLVGVDLSATMLWDHPTIASLAAYLAEILAPQEEPEGRDVEVTPDSTSGVLDALFDSVESA